MELTIQWVQLVSNIKYCRRDHKNPAASSSVLFRSPSSLKWITLHLLILLPKTVLAWSIRTLDRLWFWIICFWKLSFSKSLRQRFHTWSYVALKKRNNLICTCHCFIYLEIHLCKMTCLTVPQTILKIAHAVRSFKKQRVSFFIRNEESSF